jgi:gluconolactonase
MTDLAALTAFVKDNARAVVEPGATVEKIASGFTWAEGPVETPDGDIYFTDNRENHVHRLSPDGSCVRFMPDGKRANGLYLDRDGGIIACAGDPKALLAIDRGGQTKVIVDSYQGKPLNAPNDLWIDPKGGIYFTDPSWGREPGHSRVYYLAPDRTTLTPVILDMVRPNGVVGSPDGRTLYVTDWDEKVTYAFSIGDDGRVWGKRLFAPEGDDGMTVDTEGNVYLSGEAVTVYDPDGIKIDTIEVPETPANMIFAGLEKNRLVITARTGVYAVTTKTRGK